MLDLNQLWIYIESFKQNLQQVICNLTNFIFYVKFAFMSENMHLCTGYMHKTHMQSPTVIVVFKQAILEL